MVPEVAHGEGNSDDGDRDEGQEGAAALSRAGGVQGCEKEEIPHRLLLGVRDFSGYRILDEVRFSSPQDTHENTPAVGFIPLGFA